jgi:uncharacterized protein YlxP (DUF503 family)
MSETRFEHYGIFFSLNPNDDRYKVFMDALVDPIKLQPSFKHFYVDGKIHDEMAEFIKDVSSYYHSINKSEDLQQEVLNYYLAHKDLYANEPNIFKYVQHVFEIDEKNSTLKANVDTIRKTWFNVSGDDASVAELDIESDEEVESNEEEQEGGADQEGGLMVNNLRSMVDELIIINDKLKEQNDLHEYININLKRSESMDKDEKKMSTVKSQITAYEKLKTKNKDEIVIYITRIIVDMTNEIALSEITLKNDPTSSKNKELINYRSLMKLMLTFLNEDPINFNKIYSAMDQLDLIYKKVNPLSLWDKTKQGIASGIDKVKSQASKGLDSNINKVLAVVAAAVTAVGVGALLKHTFWSKSDLDPLEIKVRQLLYEDYKKGAEQSYRVRKDDREIEDIESIVLNKLEGEQEQEKSFFDMEEDERIEREIIDKQEKEEELKKISFGKYYRKADNPHKIYALVNGKEQEVTSTSNYGLGRLHDKDTCFGSHLKGANTDQCTNYINKCLGGNGDGIKECKEFIEKPDFWEITDNEVRNYIPSRAVDLLRRLGFKIVNRYDEVAERNLNKIESVDEWLDRLNTLSGESDGNENEDVARIRNNLKLISFLQRLVVKLNSVEGAAILNENFYGKEVSNAEIAKTYNSTRASKYGILPRQNDTNSTSRLRAEINSPKLKSSLALGEDLRELSEADGEILTMDGGAHKQRKSSFRIFLANKRSKKEAKYIYDILKQMYNNSLSELHMRNKDIKKSEKIQIEKILRDLERKEKKLFEAFNYIHKYAAIVDATGNKSRGIASINQLKEIVTKRNKLFTKTNTRQNQLLSILDTINGAVTDVSGEQQTSLSIDQKNIMKKSLKEVEEKVDISEHSQYPKL